jgi:hypothetical protein
MIALESATGEIAVAKGGELAERARLQEFGILRARPHGLRLQLDPLLARISEDLANEWRQ